MITPTNMIGINGQISSFNRTNMKHDNKVKPSFTGKTLMKLPSGKYPVNDIKRAKYFIINGDSKPWREEMYERIYTKLRDSHGTIISDSNAKPSDTLDRFNVDVVTFGLAEIFLYQPRDRRDKRIAREAVNYWSKITNDLSAMKIKEDSVNLKKTELAANRKLQYISKMDEFKEKKIQREILEPIQRKRENRPTVLPNTVMFSSKDSEVNESLINWTKDNANANIITIDAKKTDLIEVLDKAEEQYRATGDWNLIHAQNMDELINPKLSSQTTIESMKDIMCATSNDYHSTILFSATDPSKLDSIALQPHRVKKFDMSDLKSTKELMLEDAKSRVTDEVAQRETPISVMNDLLFIATGNPDTKISWYNSLSKGIYDDAYKVVKKKFLGVDGTEPKIKTKKEYTELFDTLYTPEEYKAMDEATSLDDISKIAKNKSAERKKTQSEGEKYMSIFNKVAVNVR